ncbi:MAG: rod shape-determining protein MreC [Bacteroidales bacterium]|jgi:rod shape-determining protein MreC|nr:rod shape-determining protein MreC [Bacteroidales bacterium]
MRNLLNFLERYSNLIIFLLLESVAFYLITSRSYYHNTKAVNGMKWLTHGVETGFGNVKGYFHLKTVNENLANENTMLRNTVGRLLENDSSSFFPVCDTVYQQTYLYTSARLTGNSVNKQYNFFTINRGTKSGLTPDMAVIADGSAAGVISGCSDNFSIVMSLINLDFRLSARIKSNGYFGSLAWDGKDYRVAILSDIPQHVAVNIGDTIETTGYSAIFPEGIAIGVVSGYEKPGSDFYTIKVLLKTDFRKLHYVDVVANKRKLEFIELENEIQ